MKHLYLILFLFSYSFQMLAQEDFRDHYYEFGKKKEVKVYKFFDKTTETPFFKKVTTFPTSGYVRIQFFHHFYKKEMETQEAVLPDGVRLEVVRMLESCDIDPECYEEWKVIGGRFNSMENAPIFSNTSLVWNAEKNARIEYKFLAYTKFSRVRSFESTERIIVMGEEYQAKKYRDQHTVKISHSNETIRFEQFVYLVEGLGIVKYEAVLKDDEDHSKFRQSLRVFSRNLKYERLVKSFTLMRDGFIDAELVAILTMKEFRQERKQFRRDYRKELRSK